MIYLFCENCKSKEVIYSEEDTVAAGETRFICCDCGNVAGLTDIGWAEENFVHDDSDDADMFDDMDQDDQSYAYENQEDSDEDLELEDLEIDDDKCYSVPCTKEFLDYIKR